MYPSRVVIAVVSEGVEVSGKRGDEMKFRRAFSAAILMTVLWVSGTVLAVCPSADVTGDCWVDFQDIAVAASQWQTVEIPNCPSADLTGDCWVDFRDIQVMAEQWLTGEMPHPDVKVLDQVICADAYAQGTFVSASPTWIGNVDLDTDPNYLSAPAVKFTALPYPYADALTVYARTPMAYLQDLSDVTDIYFRIYVHPGEDGTVTDWHGIKSVGIYLEDYTLGSANKRRVYYPFAVPPEVNQVSTFTPGGVIESSDVFTLTINQWDGPNDVISVTGATNPAEVVSLLKAAWASDTSHVCSSITASGTNTLVLTNKAPTGGFSVIPSTKESDGSRADGQTFTVSTVYPQNVDYAPGWYDCYINVSHINSDTGVDMTRIKRYSIVINRRGVGTHATREMTPTITFDRIQFLQNTKKAKLMWRFDDTKSIYVDWCAYLEQNNMRATIALETAEVGQVPTYMTFSQLQMLRDAGHYMSNHCTGYHDAQSWSPTYFADGALFLSQYNTALAWMYANGFPQGARTFTLPGGKWNAAWESQFSSVTDAIWGIGERWSGEDEIVFSAIDKKHIGCTFADGPDNTEAMMEGLIDKAIAGHGLAAFYLHGDSSDTAKLKAVVDYAKVKIDQGLLECVTPDGYSH
jgi:hypothetical protein